jgi:hypothetical protein
LSDVLSVIRDGTGGSVSTASPSPQAGPDE